MFAQPAALLLFIAKELADGEPLERLAEFALMRSDDPRERGSQLRTQSHFTFAFVDEIEELLDDLGAALFPVELGRLKHWAVPFDATVSVSHSRPAVEDLITARGSVL